MIKIKNFRQDNRIITIFDFGFRISELIRFQFVIWIAPVGASSTYRRDLECGLVYQYSKISNQNPKINLSCYPVKPNT